MLWINFLLTTSYITWYFWNWLWYEILYLYVYSSPNDEIMEMSKYHVFVDEMWNIEQLVFSSTGWRPVSYCIGVVSVVRPFVCQSVFLSERVCIRKFFLQKTFLKQMTGFLQNFTGMFLRWSSFKFLQIIVFYGNQSKKPLKIFSSQTIG